VKVHRGGLRRKECEKRKGMRKEREKERYNKKAPVDLSEHADD